MTTAPKQILFIGLDETLLQDTQKALMIGGDTYHLVATDEPAEAIMALASTRFSLLLVDFETDFTLAVETITRVMYLPLSSVPARLALMRRLATHDEMAAMVRCGVTRLVKSNSQRTDILTAFVEKHVR
jgi:hypothetical protein